MGQLLAKNSSAESARAYGNVEFLAPIYSNRAWMGYQDVFVEKCFCFHGSLSEHKMEWEKQW